MARLRKVGEDVTHCKLCGGPGPIRMSHVIPNFFFRELKREETSFFAILPDSKNKAIKMQKGHTEPMLCDSCEQAISKYERYMRDIMYANPKEIGADWIRTETDRMIVYEKLDYPKFKLFQLSLLWKAHASVHQFFSEVDLGPHECRIREMILNQDPGKPYEYPCLLGGILARPGELANLMEQPRAGRLRGREMYQLILGGLYWLFLVSQHGALHDYARDFLGPVGRLEIPLLLMRDIPELQDTIRRIQEAKHP